jgi:hypothetical protein
MPMTDNDMLAMLVMSLPSVFLVALVAFALVAVL